MLDFEGFIDTAPLWEDTFLGLQQFTMPFIDLSTFVPSEIPIKLRLGHRIEHIFGQLITHSRQYDLIAHNLQIQKEKITVGELDFILQDRKTGQLVHVELSYKFYILDPSLKIPIQRAMGPNRKDQFFAKMEKTNNKQLPIVFTAEGRHALQQLQIIPESLDQQCCFLGQLFVPYQTVLKKFDPFPNGAIVGYWLGISEFMTTDFHTHSYYIPNKFEWLHIPHEDVLWQTHEQIIGCIAEQHVQERAPMVWIRTIQGPLEKCFVVWWA